MNIQVTAVAPEDVESPRSFLEEASREGEPLPEEFVGRLRNAVASEAMEILAACIEGRTVGVAVVAYRPNISAAADFASIEELYVSPGARNKGVGRALLDAVGERCLDRGVSYVEVQTDDEAADFYAALGYGEEAGVRIMSQSLMICRE